MNMTWFPRTTHLCPSTTAFRALTLGTAIASSALFGSIDRASAQQVKSLQHDGMSFPVVQASEAASLMTLPESFGPSRGNASLASTVNPIQQVGLLDGCDSGSCDSAGGGFFSGLHGQKSSGSCGSSDGFGAGASCYGGSGCLECPTVDPFCYARVEAVLMRREGLEGFTRSQNFDLDEYDFELGSRITIGRVPDAVSGQEVSFTGPLNWDMSNTIANATGQTLLSELIPGSNLGSPVPENTIGFTFIYDPEDVTLDINGDIVSFDDFPLDPVLTQRQRYESQYWTTEISQTMMAWDIAKFSFGGRYINFEEEYSYTASNGPADDENGFILAETTNNLIGLQVGLEIFTPICIQNLSTYMRGKAGVYYNLTEALAVVDDQGERLSGFSDDDSNFAGMLEISNGVEYRLGEMLSIHGGSELWYLAEVATAERQLPSLVGARVASGGLDDSDDVLFLGFSFGATLKF